MTTQESINTNTQNEASVKLNALRKVIPEEGDRNMVCLNKQTIVTIL